jgi:hypothetical protein
MYVLVFIVSAIISVRYYTNYNDRLHFDQRKLVMGAWPFIKYCLENGACV